MIFPIGQRNGAVAPNTGWGAALNSTVTGTLSASGDCVLNGTSFPVQSLAPANGVIRAGDAGARTTATVLGAIGYCTTTWNLVLTASDSDGLRWPTRTV
ncbi:hypothetical protein [Actinoplanes sp. NPDC026623]|uniref:hypothetical protein n=1 Tax=Actinoplanes sp. NPDC026623 TaxID=3155610 RepID=UPI0034035757